MIKRVLIITPTFAPDVGGVETMLENFCSYLAQHKIGADVITYAPLIVRTNAPLKQRLNDYVTVWRIPWIGFGLFNIFEHYPPVQFLYLVPALLIATFIFLLTRARRIDMIHAFGLSGAFAGGLAAQLFCIPCVVDMCTVYRLPERPKLAKFTRFFLNWSDYVRGNNPAGREELIEIGLNPAKVGMITPPVDELIFKPMSQVEARRKIGLPAEVFSALFVGRMVESKGVELAVAATRLVKSTQVTFLFVGEGPLQYLVKEAACFDKRIRLTGNARHQDLVYYYNAADILMCAPVDAELIAFVGREALMCGLPILAPNIAVYFGISKPVNSKLIPLSIGRLFAPQAEVLAATLEELINLKKKQESLPFQKEACREYALTHFSTKALDWLSDAYEKVCKTEVL